MDSYLKIAEKVLATASAPLSAREILSRAFDLEIIPEHIHGRTIYKTLHARIAEDIRKKGNASLFYRYAPGRFVLRRRLYDLSFDSKYQSEFLARPRRKELQKDDVLMLGKERLPILKPNTLNVGIEWLVQLFEEGEHYYLDRRQAEQTDDALQVVTYVAVSRDKSLLCYVRGRFATAGQEFRGRRSIGFGGHVELRDADLFDTAGSGLMQNAKRELHEELLLDVELLHRADINRFLLPIGVLVDDTTNEGRKHIAVAFILRLGEELEFRKGELSVNNLEWIDYRSVSNHLFEFEAWSQYFLSYLIHEQRDIQTSFPSFR